MRLRHGCQVASLVLLLGFPSVARGVAGTCHASLLLGVSQATFLAIGDEATITIDIGSGLITGGALNQVTIDRVRYELDCSALAALGIPCTDQGDIMSYAGDGTIISSGTTCAGLTWSTNLPVGGSSPNEVVFTPSSPIVFSANVPADGLACELTFRVKLDNLEPTSGPDFDGTPTTVEVVAGYSIVPPADTTCDNGLHTGVSSSGFVDLCPTCTGDACTSSACNTSTGQCDTTPLVSAPCADTDGNACTTAGCEADPNDAGLGICVQTHLVDVSCASTTTTSTAASTTSTTSTTTPGNLPPDCSAAAANPAVLWPPNHRFVDVSVAGVTDPDGDPVAITVTGITQDEPVDAGGDGNTCPDASGIGTATASVRSERDGGGDGRVYHIGFVADDSRGAQCAGTVTVCVPHDQGRGMACGDRGPLVDATEPTCTGTCADGCAVDRDVARTVCPGEDLPPPLAERLTEAQQLASRAAGASDRHQARRLMRRGVKALKQATVIAARAARKGTISRACAASVRMEFGHARVGADRWLRSR